MKQRKEKKLMKMLRKANALVTCAALTYATLPADVYAQTQRVQKANDFTSAALGIMQNLTNFAQQNQQQQMSQGQIQAMQSFQKFQQDAQGRLQMDQMGSNRHYIFNNCMVPPDKGLRPVGLCQSSAVPPEMMAASMKIAQDYINMYDRHLRPQNSSASSGKQCIQNSLKALADQANSMLSDFDKMYADYEAQRKEIENQLQMQRKKLSDSYALLNGPKSARASQDIKNTDFRDMFPKECVDIMGTGKLNAEAQKGGLLGISKALSNTDERASDYRGRQLSNIQKQIKRDKAALQKKIKNGGMAALSSKTLLTGIQFKGVFTKALQDKFTPLNEEVSRANAILKEIGVSDSIPSMTDPSFEIKMNKIVQNANNSYKDEFITGCINGSNSAAYSSSLSQVVNNFDHRKTNNGGTTIDKFKSGVTDAISGSKTVDQLQKEIARLNNNDIKVSVTNQNNATERKTLTKYFNDILNECTMIYEGKLDPAGDSSVLANYKAQAEKAKSELNKIKKAADGMLVSNAGAGQDGSIEKYVDELLNQCGGEVVDATQCSDKNVYQKSSPSFCLKRATTCSGFVNACNQQAEKYVQDKTNEVKGLADQYNAQVKLLEDNANAMTAAMNKRVEDMAVSLHNSLFPSSLPPELKAMYGIPTFTGLQQDAKIQPINAKATDQAFPGIFLKAGGMDIKSLGKNLGKNVANIKKMFSNHVNEQVQYATKIIDGNLAQWEKEKGEWESFRNDCTSAIASMQESAMQQQQDAAQAQSEANQKQLQFCQKYAAMAAAPGCDGDFSPESLYSEALEISGHLGQDVFGALDEYRNVCLQSQNEGQDDESTSDKNHLANACRKFGDTESVKKKFIENLVNDLPDVFREDGMEEKIVAYIEGASGAEQSLEKIDEELESSPYADKIEDLKNLFAYKAKKSSLPTAAELYPDDKDKQKLINEFLDANLVQASESELEDGDFCADLDNEAGYKRFNECRSSSSIENYKKCINDNDEDWAKEKLTQRGQFRKVSTAIQKLSMSGKKNAWAEIGEKTGGTSCAHIAGGRNLNSGSIFEQLGQMDNLGVGQNPFGNIR
ncbi:hypothetical protein [Bacteriovorax sp. DB6_IX]|uniref:hypothetical protein n=1 Tax=Bacteriovorax sp. DB6_IX TaxID=1353530 RepID=UPI000389F806|nr:hypothetical protein [Bacteriovorax sp. DB6_IX]EQC52785.1 hypothetical protein M901_0949 [Bacteriovorax sp. DB6_IX]